MWNVWPPPSNPVLSFCYHKGWWAQPADLLPFCFQWSHKSDVGFWEDRFLVWSKKAWYLTHLAHIFESTKQEHSFVPVLLLWKEWPKCVLLTQHTRVPSFTWWTYSSTNQCDTVCQESQLLSIFKQQITFILSHQIVYPKGGPFQNEIHHLGFGKQHREMQQQQRGLVRSVPHHSSMFFGSAPHFMSCFLFLPYSQLPILHALLVQLSLSSEHNYVFCTLHWKLTVMNNNSTCPFVIMSPSPLCACCISSRSQPVQQDSPLQQHHHTKLQPLTTVWLAQHFLCLMVIVHTLVHLPWMYIMLDL